MKTNKYWFVPKKYGWGFVPISWEGWSLTACLILFLLISAYIDNFTKPNIKTVEGLRFLLDFVLICFVFSLVSLKKTKGKVKWRWGK